MISSGFCTLIGCSPFNQIITPSVFSIFFFFTPFSPDLMSCQACVMDLRPLWSSLQWQCVLSLISVSLLLRISYNWLWTNLLWMSRLELDIYMLDHLHIFLCSLVSPPTHQKLFVIITFSKHIVEQMVSLIGWVIQLPTWRSRRGEKGGWAAHCLRWKS